MNLKGTKQKIADSGRTLQGWCRVHGFDGVKMMTRFAGKTKFSEEQIAALKADGLYVETKDETAE